MDILQYVQKCTRCHKWSWWTLQCTYVVMDSHGAAVSIALIRYPPDLQRISQVKTGKSLPLAMSTTDNIPDAIRDKRNPNLSPTC